MAVEQAVQVCEVTLDGEQHLIQFWQDDLDHMGEDIMVFYAWLEDGLLAVSATLRGDESPVPDYATDFDGPWFIHEREV